MKQTLLRPVPFCKVRRPTLELRSESPSGRLAQAHLISLWCRAQCEAAVSREDRSTGQAGCLVGLGTGLLAASRWAQGVDLALGWAEGTVGLAASPTDDYHLPHLVQVRVAKYALPESRGAVGQDGNRTWG